MTLRSTRVLSAEVIFSKTVHKTVTFSNERKSYKACSLTMLELDQNSVTGNRKIIRHTSKKPIKEIQEIRKYFKLNESKSTTYQNL